MGSCWQTEDLKVKKKGGGLKEVHLQTYVRGPGSQTRLLEALPETMS